jgi:hypothetical protein
MRAALPRILLVLAVAVGSAAGSPALADQPTAKDLARAREDFRRALSLEVAGDHASALALFKQIALIKSTPQIRFHIAVCEEKTGDLVQALGSYKLALIDAEETKGNDAKEVAKESRAAIAALEPRIASITLARGDGASGAKVQLDGRELTDVTGNAFPINPGRHSVTASAPGRESVRLEFVLADGEKKKIDLVLPPEKVKDVPPTPTGPIATAAPTATNKDIVTPPGGGSSLRTAGVVVGSAGLVGLALGGVFLGLRQSTIDKLDAACGPDKQQCPPELLGTSQDGKLYTTLSMALLIGGGVVAAGGVTFFIVGSATKPKTGATASFMAGAPGTPAGGTLFLRF